MEERKKERKKEGKKYKRKQKCHFLLCTLLLPLLDVPGCRSNYAIACCQDHFSSSPAQQDLPDAKRVAV
ncbi:hypothetical protein AALO_G00216060 [Alosa alosa]|uniref:Uncharacterized protein n=1 Tax=Alosa alosa TaxID=278164 RepID=A0AAV6G5J2_9TELE|nr:hypothetical protein AALO_G00216060 [Alosa alosa]